MVDAKNMWVCGCDGGIWEWSERNTLKCNLPRDSIHNKIENVCTHKVTRVPNHRHRRHLFSACVKELAHVVVCNLRWWVVWEAGGWAMLNAFPKIHYINNNRKKNLETLRSHAFCLNTQILRIFGQEICLHRSFRFAFSFWHSHRCAPHIRAPTANTYPTQNTYIILL